jgi:hypothetical protein
LRPGLLAFVSFSKNRAQNISSQILVNSVFSRHQKSLGTFYSLHSPKGLSPDNKLPREFLYTTKYLGSFLPEQTP